MVTMPLLPTESYVSCLPPFSIFYAQHSLVRPVFLTLGGEASTDTLSATPVVQTIPCVPNLSVQQNFFNMYGGTSNFRRAPTGGSSLSRPSIHILSFILTKGDILLLLLVDYFHTSLYWCTDFMPLAKTSGRILRSSSALYFETISKQTFCYSTHTE